jgi:transposase
MLPTEIRCLVQSRRADGWSFRKIAHILSLSRSTVRGILTRTFTDGSSRATGHAGRPRRFNKRDERAILNHATKNPFMTIQELITAVFGKEQARGISKQTISRILGRFGVYNVRAQRKPLLTHNTRHLRLRYANENKNTDWTHVIFSDEKRFQLHSNGPKRVWRKRGSFKDCKNVIETKKYGSGSIMIWLAVRSDGMLWVFRCSDHMDSVEYCSILDLAQQHGMMVPNANHKNMYFQQDNASVHRSAHTKRFFEQNNWSQVNHPPQSPDLNIVEHIWPMIMRKLPRKTFDTKNELWGAILMACMEILGTEELKSLFHSMSRRIEAVENARGGHTTD